MAGVRTDDFLELSDGETLDCHTLEAGEKAECCQTGLKTWRAKQALYNDLQVQCAQISGGNDNVSRMLR